MIKFDIVDGSFKGYATATVDISFDIPEYDLLSNRTTSCEADSPEEYLDLMRDTLEMYIQSHIEAEMDNLGYNCSNEVCIDSCNESKLLEVDMDVEVDAVETEEEETEEELEGV